MKNKKGGVYNRCKWFVKALLMDIVFISMLSLIGFFALLDKVRECLQRRKKL